MDKNIEIEYKILLDKDTFDRILESIETYCYTQINYYFISLELHQHLMSLRVRYKNNKYEMTLKVSHGFMKDEYNIDIDENTFKNMKNHIFPDNEITHILLDEGINIHELTQNYHLKTIRHDKTYAHAILSLDENHYLNKIDYELEYELLDESGHQDFKEFCKQYNLTYIHNCPSKIKRLLDSI